VVLEDVQVLPHHGRQCTRIVVLGTHPEVVRLPVDEVEPPARFEHEVDEPLHEPLDGPEAKRADPLRDVACGAAGVGEERPEPGRGQGPQGEREAQLVQAAIGRKTREPDVPAGVEGASMTGRPFAQGLAPPRFVAVLARAAPRRPPGSRVGVGEVETLEDA
jgi:hypothetical protein